MSTPPKAGTPEPVDRVAYFVTYNPTLVSHQFMAEHLGELEGVHVVRTEDAD